MASALGAGPGFGLGGGSGVDGGEARVEDEVDHRRARRAGCGLEGLGTADLRVTDDVGEGGPLDRAAVAGDAGYGAAVLGGLGAWVIGVALICDVFVLPALLVLFGRGALRR